MPIEIIMNGLGFLNTLLAEMVNFEEDIHIRSIPNACHLRKKIARKKFTLF